MSEPIREPDSSQQPEPAVVAEDAELAGLQAQLLSLQAQGQNGANWFYWVAGLSLVNSVISLVGGGIAFVIGLSITGIADGVAAELADQRPDLAVLTKGCAFVFSLFVSAVLVAFGWLSNKRWIPVFALGMFLYLLDGLLYVLLQQWMCVAFHAFALFQMWQGLLAYRKLSAILSAQPQLNIEPEVSA